jgi:hypothetical protein
LFVCLFVCMNVYVRVCMWEEVIPSSLVVYHD